MKALIKKIWNMYKKHEEIINYLFIGGLTTVVSLGVYYGLTLTVLDPKDLLQLQIANIVSWVASVTFAYVTNKLFVFKCRNTKIIKEMISFYTGRILTLLLDMGFMFVFVTWLGLNDKIIKIIVQVLIVIFNYIISKFIFKKEKKS